MWSPRIARSRSERSNCCSALRSKPRRPPTIKTTKNDTEWCGVVFGFGETLLRLKRLEWDKQVCRFECQRCRSVRLNGCSLCLVFMNGPREVSEAMTDTLDVSFCATRWCESLFRGAMGLLNGGVQMNQHCHGVMKC